MSNGDTTSRSVAARTYHSLCRCIDNSVAQTTTFEAERQAFYDNEQHLKSRIQSLTQARKQPPPVLTSPSVVSVAESETDVEEQSAEEPPAEKQDLNDPEQEPAEMTMHVSKGVNFSPVKNRTIFFLHFLTLCT